MTIAHVPLSKITPNPWQDRLGEPNREYIEELAADIGKNGLNQPPMGRLVLNDDGGAIDFGPAELRERLQQVNVSVQLAFGHNRLAAFRRLAETQPGQGFDTIPVDVRNLDDEQMALKAWSENDKRRGLTPLERALAIRRRIEHFKWTQDEAAEHLSVSRPVVSNALRLLRLPQDVQDDLQAGRLSERQGLALLPLFDVDPALARLHHFEVSVNGIIGLARQGASSETLRERASEAIAFLERQVQPALIEKTARSEEPEAPIEEAVGEGEQPGERTSSLGEQIEEAGEPERAEDVVTPARQAVERPTMQETAEGAAVAVLKPAPAITEEAPVETETTAPKSWAESTIDLTISLWPEDGQAGGRPALITGRCNGGAPVVRLVREHDLALPQEMTEMIERFRSKMEGSNP